MFNRKIETKSGSHFGSDIDELLTDSEKEDENDDVYDNKAGQLAQESSERKDNKVEHSAEKVKFITYSFCDFYINDLPFM